MAPSEDEHRCVWPALTVPAMNWWCSGKERPGDLLGMAEHVTHIVSCRDQLGSVGPYKKDPGWSGAWGGRSRSPTPRGGGVSGISGWFGAGATWPPSLPQGVSALGVKCTTAMLTLEAGMNPRGAPLFQLSHRRACGAQEESPRAWWVRGWSLAVTPESCGPTATRAQSTPIKGALGGRAQDWTV